MKKTILIAITSFLISSAYCEEEKLTNTGVLIKSDNLEYSIGYLHAKGLIKTKKQLVEGNVQVCSFPTDEGNRTIRGKIGLMKPS